jgi:hypothetical protein
MNDMGMDMSLQKDMNTVMYQEMESRMKMDMKSQWMKRKNGYE